MYPSRLTQPALGLNMVQKRERGGKKVKSHKLRSLKGKEIGLYYAALKKEKKQEKQKAAKKAALEEVCYQASLLSLWHKEIDYTYNLC